MSVASTIKSTTKKIQRHPLAWVAASAAAVAAVIGGVMYAEKSSSASPKPTPTPTPTPANTPIWTRLTPVQNGAAYLVNIPANATYAISAPANDPQLTNLVSFLNLPQISANVGSVQTYQPGWAPPATYPQDGLGTTGYRTTGVVTGNGFSVPVTQSEQVFIITGFTS